MNQKIKNLPYKLPEILGSLNRLLFYFLFLASVILNTGCSGCSSSGRKSKKLAKSTFVSEISPSTEIGTEQNDFDNNYPVNCGLDAGKFYSVKTLVDGDTFWLEDDCNGVKIRLIGIDAPESRNMFGTIEEEPFGKESSVYLEQLLQGKNVRVEFDIDSLDQYQRTLAYCFTDDGTFLNLKMVEEGMAQIMTIPPNVKYQDIFYSAQVKAREAKKGFWSIGVK